MDPLSAAQIKAARAMLDWSQGELAQATGLSATTIGNLESGAISPRTATAQIIRQAIEQAGLEFIAGDGIRRRNDTIQIIQGPTAGARLVADILQTLATQLGVIQITARTESDLLHIFDRDPAHSLRLVEQIAATHAIHCLTTVSVRTSPLSELVEFRPVPALQINPAASINYGTKHGLIMQDYQTSPQYIICQSVMAVDMQRRYFTKLWTLAATVLEATDARLGS